MPTVVSPGNMIVAFASELNRTLTKSPELKNSLGVSQISTLSEIIKNVSFDSPQSKEKMWAEVLKLMSPEEHVRPFTELAKTFPKYNKNVANSLYSFLIDKLVLLLIKFENEHKKCADIEVKTDITPGEEQVIYYISGYIVYSLRKKYTRFIKLNTNNMSARIVLQFLNSINANHSEHLSGNTYHEFVRKWTKLVSRGYLIEVNDEMFEFTKQLELVVSSVLNTKFICKYSGQDLRDVIERKISDNELIVRAWKVLLRSIMNETLTNLIKKQMIIKWIDIRAKSFVNPYIQVLKRRRNSHTSDNGIKLATIAKPALRKTLHSGN